MKKAIWLILFLLVLVSCGSSYSEKDLKLLNTTIDENNYYTIPITFESKELMIKFNEKNSNLFNNYYKQCISELGVKQKGASYSNDDLDKIEDCAFKKVLNEITGMTVKQFMDKYN